MSRINKESAFAVVALAILFFVLINNKEQKLPETESESNRIKYWPFVEIMWNPNDNLRTVKRVFDRFGHKKVNGSDDWDVFWSLEYPFYMFSEQMKSLKPHQRVNHFPGINYLTHKAFMATNNLFPFITMLQRIQTRSLWLNMIQTEVSKLCQSMKSILKSTIIRFTRNLWTIPY